jgi:hypothetical protein
MRINVRKKTTKVLTLNNIWPWVQAGPEARWACRLIAGSKLLLLKISWRKTSVEAGSGTSTVALRVIGGDETGSLKSETVKYGHESQGTRTRERLGWQGPAVHTIRFRMTSQPERMHSIIKVRYERNFVTRIFIKLGSVRAHLPSSLKNQI